MLINLVAISFTGQYGNAGLANAFSKFKMWFKDRQSIIIVIVKPFSNHITTLGGLLLKRQID